MPASYAALDTPVETSTFLLALSAHINTLSNTAICPEVPATVTLFISTSSKTASSSAVTVKISPCSPELAANAADSLIRNKSAGVRS
jgi:hypothetical protein